MTPVAQECYTRPMIDTKYTWEDAAKDIAYTTSMTLSEAAQFLFPFRKLPADEVAGAFLNIAKAVDMEDPQYFGECLHRVLEASVRHHFKTR